MKKSFGLVLIAFLAVSVCRADAWDDAVAKAHALKAKGDYVGAAEAHPRALCKAMYYWNAACAVVGHRDSSGDWAINPVVTADQKAQGLSLLGLASQNLEAATQKAGLTAPDDGTCKGVDPGDLKDLIGKVTDCINGHCQ